MKNNTFVNGDNSTDESIFMLSSAVVMRARDLIDFGWVKGSFHKTENGQYKSFCILGALQVAAEELLTKDNKQLVRQVIDVSSKIILEEISNYMFEQYNQKKYNASSIPYWNDSIAKSQEEVLFVMQKSADRIYNFFSGDENSNEQSFDWNSLIMEEIEDSNKNFLYATLNN